MVSLSYRFPKASRLLKRKEFQALFRSEYCRIGAVILVEFRHGKGPRPRIGITVSRRFGKAHKRNRFKRIVREAFRLCQHQLPQQIELVVKPRSLAEKAKTPDVIRELLALTYVNKVHEQKSL